MCFGERELREYNRRTVVAGVAATAVATGALFPGIVQARAASVQTETVEFPAADMILRGHLARPVGNGPYPAVVLAHGNAGLPPDILFAAYYLAQAGFAALVYDWAVRAPLPEGEAAQEQWRNRLFRNEFVSKQIADVRAAATHLRSQAYVSRRGIGMVGFCGGGRLALLAAAESRDFAAIVSLYGPVDYHQRRDAADPVPHAIDLVSRIRIPVQGHYGLNDAVALPADARRFERLMRAQGSPVEMFYYPGAGHSFCNYTRPAGSDPGYDFHADACDAAYRRTVRFLRRHL